MEHIISYFILAPEWMISCIATNNYCLVLRSKDTGTGVRVHMRSTGIQEFDKYNNLGIRVGGRSIYYIYIYSCIFHVKHIKTN